MTSYVVVSDANTDILNNNPSVFSSNKEKAESHKSLFVNSSETFNPADAKKYAQVFIHQNDADNLKRIPANANVALTAGVNSLSGLSEKITALVVDPRITAKLLEELPKHISKILFESNASLLQRPSTDANISSRIVKSLSKSVTDVSFSTAIPTETIAALPETVTSVRFLTLPSAEVAQALPATVKEAYVPEETNEDIKNAFPDGTAVKSNTQRGFFRSLGDSMVNVTSAVANGIATGAGAAYTGVTQWQYARQAGILLGAMALTTGVTAIVASTAGLAAIPFGLSLAGLGIAGATLAIGLPAGLLIGLIGLATPSVYHFITSKFSAPEVTIASASTSDSLSDSDDEAYHSAEESSDASEGENVSTAAIQNALASATAKAAATVDALEAEKPLAQAPAVEVQATSVQTQAPAALAAPAVAAEAKAEEDAEVEAPAMGM